MAKEKKGRVVNLIDTGEKGNSLTAYRVEQNGKGKFFSSEEGYNKWLANSQLRKECIGLMFEIMGYETTMIMPGRFFKELESWGSTYGFGVVKLCMQNSVKSNNWVFDKEFDTEAGKVNYWCSIFRNSMNDAAKQFKRELELKEIKQDEVTEEIADVDLYAIGNTSKSSNNAVDLLGDL